MFDISRRRLCAVSVLSLLGAWSDLAKPGPQSVVGMKPVGFVDMTEVVVGGNTLGQGKLIYNGQMHNFKLLGGITGGGGAAKDTVHGDVYNMNKLSDFPGLYTESLGSAGLDKSSTGDLWLRNTSGVVIHVTGAREGATLSLGRGEALVEMF